MAHGSFNRDGLLVIERAQIGGGTVLLAEERELTAEEVQHRYKGIEGQPWPEEEAVIVALEGDEGLLERGLAPLGAYDAIRAYYAQVSQRHRCDFLYCSISEGWGNTARGLPATFSFYGYDYGYYMGAYNNFSALFNDVIYGGYPSLQAFASHLNDYLLLPNLDAVHALDSTRRQLIGNGAYLENDEEFTGIAVYGYMA